MNAAAEAGTPLSVRHVLVPLDGSEFSAAALPTARALSARFSADVVLVAVAAHERDADRLRRDALASLGDDAPNDVEVVVAEGTAEAIVARARELPSCVVCMSTRGRGRIAGAMIGSVGRAVLQLCGLPVLAVGPQADRPPALVGRPRRRPESWPEPLSAGPVVACVDGSSSSEAVLPEAARWASALGLGLTVLTVADDTASTTGAATNRFGPPDPQGYVDTLAAEWSAVVPGAVGEVVVDPIGVASGVRSRLGTDPAGLLAVTTHARSGLERVRLGSAAADIVRTSTAPVLVVPVPDGT